METVLARHKGLSTEPYLDDLTPHGTQWRKVWEDTMITLRLLVEEGIMINIKKCKFLVERLELLGFVLYHHHYQLGHKAMKKFYDLKLP